MHFLLIFCALGAVTNARPQNSGYQYSSQGLFGSKLGLSSANSIPSQSFARPSNGFNGFSGQLSGANTNSNGAFAQPNRNFQNQPQSTTEGPIINKQFYIHSAPEDTDSFGQTRHLVLGRAQKNYRVIFIKAPASGLGNVKLSAEYAPQEEKTVIYVLTQKEHELDANDIVTPAPTQPSKPEVFFIKYKTPEEAAHAQKEIQSQYDSLGGSSQVSDEGTAPISSVVGALDNQLSALSTSNSSPAGTYLPPNYLK